MSASLPVELLAVIISLCAKSDFPALCLASKTFHDITEPLLYHDVCISCRDVKTDTEARNMFERIVGLFEGLRNNGYRAAMVKRLEVMELYDHRDGSEAHQIPGFTPVLHTHGNSEPFISHVYHRLGMLSMGIAAVLSVLPELSTLHIKSHETRRGFPAVNLLGLVSCPALRQFYLNVPDDESPDRATLAYFFQRHSQLKNVELLILLETQLVLEVDTPLDLPNLEQAEAPMAFFSSLAKTTPLKHASVVLGDPRRDRLLYQDSYGQEVIERVVLRLALSRYESLSSLTTFTITQTTTFRSLHIIANYLPHLEEFEVRFPTEPNQPISRLDLYPQQTISTFAQEFSRFDCLRRIAFVWIVGPRGESEKMVEDDDHDFSAVVSWGSACPTLSRCELYGTVWERPHGEWIHVQE